MLANLGIICIGESVGVLCISHDSVAIFSQIVFRQSLALNR